MEFRASNQTIRKVIFSDERFKIPRYQRPYAWTEDEISDFWSDLSSSQEAYFLGSFIFNHEQLLKEGSADVIDGQQRILTITIFSAVLRDIAQKYEKEIAQEEDVERGKFLSERIHRQDIMIEDRDGIESVRIIPGDSISTFFEENIQIYGSNILDSKAKTAEEKRIKKVYEYFYNKVDTELSKQPDFDSKMKWISTIRTKLAELIVIRVVIASESDAYEIFETTNARGVDLSVADLLKNLIFRNMKVKVDKDDAKEAWQHIGSNVEASGNGGLQRFLRYHWLSKHKFVQEKHLYREIRNTMKNKTKKSWGDLLFGLWTDSENWKLMFDGGKEDFKQYKDGIKIFNSIFAIKLMGVVQCNVFLLSVLRNYKALETNPAKTIEFIEKFTFLYSAISKRPGNAVEKVYSKHAIQIENVVHDKTNNREMTSNEIQKIFASLRNDLSELKPSKEVFEESFAKLSYVNSDKRRQLIKYVLDKIDNELKTTREHSIDFDHVNIEHVLPQKPIKWGFTLDEVKSYVHLIGNLTLLDGKLNSDAQNYILEEKVKHLKKSTLEINKDLVDYIEQCDSWTKVEINERHQKFAELAYTKIWKI